MDNQNFCKKLEKDPCFAEKIAKSNTIEEALLIAKEAGFLFTEEEFENIPLPDSVLFEISGGSTTERQVKSSIKQAAKYKKLV